MVNAQDGKVQVHQPDVRDPPLHRNGVDSNYARKFKSRETLVEHCTNNQPFESLGRILIPCRSRWDSEMPWSCKPCSVSRFVHIVDHDRDFVSQVALLANIPRESGNLTFANPRALNARTLLRIRNGRRNGLRAAVQKCRSGAFRVITSVVEPVRTTTRCRSPGWPSPRRFSSPFWIVNFGSGSTGRDQTRYHQKSKFPRSFISQSYPPFPDH